MSLKLHETPLDDLPMWIRRKVSDEDLEATTNHLCKAYELVVSKAQPETEISISEHPDSKSLESKVKRMSKKGWGDWEISKDEDPITNAAVWTLVCWLRKPVWWVTAERMIGEINSASDED